MNEKALDNIIVGSGIIGLAFAYVLSKANKRVLVIEQHQQPVSSSIRNFGLITVTGQPYQEEWEMAKRGSEIWREILRALKLEPAQEGCLFTARSAEGEQLLHEYLSSEAGRSCDALTKHELNEQFPYISQSMRFALKSPHEIRVDSGLVITKLISYLKEKGVEFIFNCRVFQVSEGTVHCSVGKLRAEKVIVAGGTDTRFLFPQLWQAHDIKLCKLQMQLVAPASPFTLPCSVMSDFSYHFYAGFQQMPSYQALTSWFKEQYPRYHHHNMHLIVVQNTNGQFVVGDSHEYIDEIDPFAKQEINTLQLQELNNIFKENSWTSLQQWIGYYPWSKQSKTVVSNIDQHVTAVLVNRGKGMTISFALAEKTIGTLY